MQSIITNNTYPHILEIPDELWVEIFRWIKPPNNEEWLFFMINLPMVCKRFYHVLRMSEQGNFFYKFMYEKMFMWRNNKGLKEDGSNNFWFDKLKWEINFYRNCNIIAGKESYRVVQDRSLLKNNVIVFKKSVGSSIASINRPLKINTGCYYFECVFMDKIDSTDNVLFGIVLENQSNEGYIGSDKNSVGYYFSDGAIYYGGKSVKSGYGIKMYKQLVLGLLIDTDNLTLEYVTDITFEKIYLNVVAPNIAEKLHENQAILPCVSILYDNRRMKMKCFEICSYDKCSFIQEVRHQSL